MTSPSADPTARPALPRAVLIPLGMAVLVISVAGVRSFAGTLGPAFLALVLVVTVQPVQASLQRRGAPNWVAVVVLLAAVYAILIALAAALAYAVARLVTLLPTYSQQFSDLVDSVSNALTHLGIKQSQVRSAVGMLDLNNAVGVLQGLLGQVTTLLSDLFFIVTLILFLAADAVSFPPRLATAAETRPELVGALRAFAGGTREYMLVSTVFGLVVAVIDTVALYALGIPLALLWGVLSFITNYIPNIGFVVGLVPPALLALLEGGVSRMLWVVVVYSAINVVIQSFIQPKIVGDSVGMSATLTFLSLVFWAYVIGPLGALLAIPLSLLVKALLVDADPAAQWLRPLLGDGAVRADAAAGGTPSRSDRAATEPQSTRSAGSRRVTRDGHRG